MSSPHFAADTFGARGTLSTASGTLGYYRLGALAGETALPLDRLPVTVRILLENVLRHHDAQPDMVSAAEVRALAGWDPAAGANREFPFLPARVVLQDFTGVPCVVDLAAMRDAVKELGGDPTRINPLVPADLVIDHSVQVDAFGTMLAFAMNVTREYERNGERYALLRWAQKAFQDFSVVPPGTGIVHQVNLEYLGKVVQTRPGPDGQPIALPDTLIGTDSHTTMINGLGILGWGVGGIEAEAVLLGQPLYLLTPEVIGMRLSGALPEGATATDLVLAVTQLLRQHGVVGRFVEFCGAGLSTLGLADRATISNMSPEFGATATLFPVDAEALRYLRDTGRPAELVDLVERYTKEQGLFRTDDTPDPRFTELLDLDLGTIVPSLAGPRRPQDRVTLGDVAFSFQAAFQDRLAQHSNQAPTQPRHEEHADESDVSDGSVVIAAITSCTNTSNPSVMVGAGLLARNAVERGLKVKPYVKTSLAPGSRAVTDYLRDAGLAPYLDALGFQTVGYGCTTCIAEGTPVLRANGTACRIEQLPVAGGTMLFGPQASGTLALARQTQAMAQGIRECVALVLQDGRTLVCTPDHRMLCADGRWIRADQLTIGLDRVVIGLEAPLDEPGDDEAGYILRAGELTFSLALPAERERALAFARVLGHVVSGGSISAAAQVRMRVDTAVDRDVLLDDIALIAGARPHAVRSGSQQWTIVLPAALAQAINALLGARTGRRNLPALTLPACVREVGCPTALVREFLGGLFGADGRAPLLRRVGQDAEEGTALTPPVYAKYTTPQQVAALTQVMWDVMRLLARCGVLTDGAQVRTYPTQRAASAAPAAGGGDEQVEVCLQLPDGLSFVERVGYRYCVDKAMRASAATVYWRLVDASSHGPRLRLPARTGELHQSRAALGSAPARQVAATALLEREPAGQPDDAPLEGDDRFARLPQGATRALAVQRRERRDMPSPMELFEQLGVRDWFAPQGTRPETEDATRSSVATAARSLPTFALQVVDRRAAGNRPVYDLAVDDVHAFIAGTMAVHNCIGNSGPLPEPVATTVRDEDLVVAAVLSGNRNFEGRIHPQVRAAYLASPPLVVAYALAGTVNLDLTRDALGADPNDNPVYLRDIWPSQQEIRDTISRVVKPEVFTREYSHVFEGDERWQALPVPEGALFAWDPDSTYVRRPSFLENIPPEPEPVRDITGARVLVSVSDSVTTDHISPAGSIPSESPAGIYLRAHGVTVRDFNSYGARRGNHEVMVRGTFANIRLRNQLLPGKEGYWTEYLPTGEEMTIYDASMRYQQEGTPLLVIAGKEYGSGSSRDWAAKGPLLLGVRATLAESYERIHRSNLVGMGILPVQFKPGESRESLGLTGHEAFDITGLSGDLKPRQEVTIHVTREDGTHTRFTAIARLDGPVDIEYYRQGGILPAVLRRLLQRQRQ